MRHLPRKKAQRPITRDDVREAVRRFRKNGGLIRHLPPERIASGGRIEAGGQGVDPLWNGTEII